ncbi:neurogenic locus Notch protein-like [Eurytemora carolleeae]|nr:neurogenic locus Notch protein-like [Eurytemora carolleeae]|eukprot:XP_023340422.1 neurogenic locus Notch protein-like [Eurytemora affinis]
MRFKHRDLIVLVLCAVLGSALGFRSCSPDPCKHFGSTCKTDKAGNSYCDCSPDYVGEYCQYKNPCNTGEQKCLNGGTCNVLFSNNQPPTFQCTCPVGFTASLCEVPVENVCDSSPCRNGGSCHLSSLSRYTCTCPLGWKGKTCEEPDNCSSQPCRNGATCTSLGKGYRCSCKPGFNGPNCNIDVNECQDSWNNCVHGRCINTYGSYK